MSDVVVARRDRFRGCLLGLALGDAIGAYAEGGFAARMIWRMLGVFRPRLLRWTDDTQMALELGESRGELGRVDPEDLARRWARAAKWSRGYGRGTTRVLRKIRRGVDWETASQGAFPGGSYGNGGAMRVAPLALVHAGQDARDEAVALSCRVTHWHELAVAGATLIADAVQAALRSRDSDGRLPLTNHHPAFASLLEERIRLDPAAGPEDVARVLGNGIAAVESCVTAVHLAERFADGEFEDMLGFICRMGGDADTIGAMAGAVFGARRGVGAFPDQALDRLEARERIVACADALAALDVAR